MSKNEMIMLPREVAEQAVASIEMLNAGKWTQVTALAATLRASLDQPQGEQEPYLYYDPENGDTWTQEAIDDGCCPPDGLIALYTK